MIFSQAFQACILPAVAIPVYFLLKNDKIMGKHKLRPGFKAGMLAVILFSLITTWFAIADLF